MGQSMEGEVQKMPQQKKREHIVYIWVLICSVLFIVLGNWVATKDNAFFQGKSRSETYYRAKIVSVSEPRQVVEQYEDWESVYYTVDVEVYLKEGAMHDQVVQVHHRLEEAGEGYKLFPYRAGESVFVSFNFDENLEPVWFLVDHLREVPIIALVLVFFALLIWFGRRKGVNTVISLILTCLAIFLVMIPAIIKGINIYLVTFIVCTFIIVMTLCIVIGVGPKSVAAAAGCICGVGFAGLITIGMQDILYISGLLNEESHFVMYINPEIPIDLRGVIFAAIVVGALGATMDVAMSIASSLDEILYHKPKITDRELIRSGLNIGQDIMGTMANTLVLAYVGSSLNLILLLLAYNQTMGAIINREQIAVEVLQSIAGSIGILLTVPATTVVTVLARRWFRRWQGVPVAAASNSAVAVQEAPVPETESQTDTAEPADQA